MTLESALSPIRFVIRSTDMLPSVRWLGGALGNNRRTAAPQLTSIPRSQCVVRSKPASPPERLYASAGFAELLLLAWVALILSCRIIRKPGISFGEYAVFRGTSPPGWLGVYKLLGTGSLLSHQSPYFIALPAHLLTYSPAHTCPLVSSLQWTSLPSSLTTPPRESSPLTRRKAIAVPAASALSHN